MTLARVIATSEISGELRIRVVPQRGTTAGGGVRFINSDDFTDCPLLPSGPKRGYGMMPARTTFGMKAKRAVRNGVSAIEARCPRSRCLLFTGTIPGNAKTSLAMVAMWSAWLIKRLYNHVKWIDSEAMLCHVWEYQKRGALHVHVAIGCSTSGRTTRVRRSLKKYWHRELIAISRKAGVDIARRSDSDTDANPQRVWRNRCERVKKSLARYLSKYLSKSEAADVHPDWYPPSRWWGCTDNVRKVVNDARTCFVSPKMPLAKAQGMADAYKVHLSRKARWTVAYASPVDRCAETIVSYGDGGYNNRIVGCLRRLLGGGQVPRAIAILDGRRVAWSRVLAAR